MLTSLKHKIFEYYEKNETRVDIAFFLAGFIFDVFTLSDIDDPLSILQQIVYLVVTGSVLYLEFLQPHGLTKFPERFPKVWHYRALIFHFILGSLLSSYSLFFLKSASIFSSIVFVAVLMGLMVANELKSVQQSGLNIKIGLYVICVFSFFSMMFPVILGFVGLLPFTLTVLMTAFCVYLFYKILLKKITDQKILLKRLLLPGFSVIILFFVFYLVGWIPPVPLSVQNMGIYHKIEKKEGHFILSHENPWWRFWQTGDQEFFAEPGDKIYFFARLFSPSRFSDSIVLHWSYHDPRQGWVSSDRINLPISGGRQGGYRGFAVKQNYQPGEWRVSVETTDRREIGRLYLNVILKSESTPRVFNEDLF